MIRTVACVLLTLVPTASTLASPCSIQGLEPTVAHRSSPAPVSANGGFVVMAVTTRDGHIEPTANDVAAKTTWQLRSGGTLVKPVIDVLAPGLAVYRLPAGATSVTLEDGKTVLDQVAVATKTDKRAPLDPPKVTSIKREETHARHPTTSIVIELAQAAPPQAVALVVADVKLKALAWGQPSGTSVMVYNTGGGCRIPPAGTIASSVGDKVVMFWVDEVGHVSPATQPFIVKKQ